MYTYILVHMYVCMYVHMYIQISGKKKKKKKGMLGRRATQVSFIIINQL